MYKYYELINSLIETDLLEGACSEETANEYREALRYLLDECVRVKNKIFTLNSIYGYKATDSIKKEKYRNVDFYIVFKDTKVGTDNSDYKNVDVEIKEKFIQINNGVRYFNYNINEVLFYEIRDSIDREYCENDNQITKDYIKNNKKSLNARKEKINE